MGQLPQPDRDEIDIVTVLQALGDPVRLQLVRNLAECEDALTGKQCAAGTNVTMSTVSHHFQTLREAGVTQTVLDGRVRWIKLRREDLQARFPGLLDAVLAE